jgi:hypothetical protein
MNISRANASGGSLLTAITNVTDCNNNTNWDFDIAPDVLTSLVQKKVTGGATLSTGDWTNETQVQFTATSTDNNDTDTLQICVEKDLLGTGFSNTEDSCGTGVAYSGSGVTVTVTISGQTDASEYHWQARAKDAAGKYSAWVSYGGNAESARDYGIDTTAPTGGTVNDGTGADQDVNDGSLISISANWSGFNSNVSGLVKYEYAIRRTSDNYYYTGSAWQSGASYTDNATSTSFTAGSQNLQTGETYYVSVRVTDNAGNQSIVNSNGQQVLPSISFSIGSASLTFANLNPGNSYTDTKSLTQMPQMATP